MFHTVAVVTGSPPVHDGHPAGQRRYVVGLGVLPDNLALQVIDHLTTTNQPSVPWVLVHRTSWYGSQVE